MRNLPVGTYADLRTGRTFRVAPLYREVAPVITREAIAAYNIRMADTGDRAYPRLPRWGGRLAGLGLALLAMACTGPTHPCPGYDPAWRTDTIGYVIRANGDSLPIVATSRCVEVVR